MRGANVTTFPPKPPPRAATDVMSFLRNVRHKDGTNVTGLLRTDGSYYVVVTSGSRRGERLISKDAANGFFVREQPVRAVVFAIEELKCNLRAGDLRPL
jgi:hypothetical protein